MGEGKKRRYPWPEIRHWRDTLLAQQARAPVQAKLDAVLAESGGGMSLEDARARKTAAEARMAELELAVGQGKYIAVEQYKADLGGRCEALSARIRGLGQYIGEVQLAGTDSQAAALLDRIGDDLLKTLRATPTEYVEDDDDGAPIA